MSGINRFFLLFCICCMIILMSGCGLFIKFDDQEEKELGVNEVLNKAEKRINSLIGYHILTKAQVHQQTQGQQSKNYSFELNQRINNRPKTLHSIRSHYENGSTTNQEMYVVDGVTYMNNGLTWVKASNQQDDFSYSQSPTEFLRFAAEANGQGVSVEKESDTYVLKLDKSAGKAFLHKFYSEAIEGMKLQGVYLTENDFQTEHFQQSIWVDDKTFDFKKMEMKLVYVVKYNGNTVRYDSDTQVLYQGELKEQIQLPAEVKTSTGY